MAFDPSRTEKATPKRRERARNEGSYPRSPDFDATLLLWGNYFLLLSAGSMTLTLLGRELALMLRMARPGALADPAPLAAQVALTTGRILLPYLGINMLLAIGVQTAQRGLRFTLKPLQPKFDRLNPASGFGRLFSVRSLVDTLKSLAKFLVFAAVAYAILGPRLPAMMTTMKLPLGQSLELLKETPFLLYRDVMLAMLVIGLADFFYQRQHFEKSIRMTKQEVKDEARDAEQSPEVKGKIRAMMFNAAMRRMLAAVPKATVVITNPTHFAVALRYEQGVAAPLCVAKGVDFMAFQIREKAKAAGVVVVENPPLARALYRSVKVDQAIPRELYQAVAQVLAFVYRLKGAA